MDTYNNNRLREVREASGLTVVDLSRLSGISEKTIRYIEGGERPGTNVTKNKILIGLNKNPLTKKKLKYKDVFGS